VEQPGKRSPAPEPLVLTQDLVNSVDLEMEQDRLRTPADLAELAAEHGLADLSFTVAELSASIELREALRDVCQAHAGVDLPSDAARVLDRQLATAALRLSIGADGSARLSPADGLSGLPALTARIAADIAAAVADGTWVRLKACAADTCRWVYYDRSPAGRSRWCTMALCGSRAKMRAYRSR
jgi:predicted RNA-binding Zn ribbon-like protein